MTSTRAYTPTQAYGLFRSLIEVLKISWCRQQLQCCPQPTDELSTEAITAHGSKFVQTFNTFWNQLTFAEQESVLVRLQLYLYAVEAKLTPSRPGTSVILKVSLDDTKVRYWLAVNGTHLTPAKTFLRLIRLPNDQQISMCDWQHVWSVIRPRRQSLLTGEIFRLVKRACESVTVDRVTGTWRLKLSPQGPIIQV